MRTKYLTSRSFVDFINETSGIPLKLSRFRKDRMNGVAPEPAARMGNRDLFTEEQVPAYIEKLVKETDQSAAA